MNMRASEAITRIAAPAPDEFLRDYWEPRRPVIIRGGLKGWEEGAWTPEALAQKLGAKNVEVRRSPSAVFRFGTPAVQMTFGSYVDAVLYADPARTGHLYMQQLSIPDRLPELLPEIPVPDYVPDQGLVFAVNLWLGPAGSVSPLHYDVADNILVQPYGRKRLLLFPPEQLPYLYPDPAEPHTCLVDLRAPDLERFPLLPQARCREVVVEAGEMIFLPAFWCHEVRSEELAVSVNFWWRPNLRHALTPAGLRFLSAAYGASLHSLLRDALDTREFIGLLGMARFAQARDPQAASLLACGAVDERLRLLCERNGVPADDETAASSWLQDCGLLTADDAWRIAGWRENRKKISQDAEAFRESSCAVSVDEVAGLLDRLDLAAAQAGVRPRAGPEARRASAP